MPTTRGNARSEPSDTTGPASASDCDVNLSQSPEVSGADAILAAITSLRSDMQTNKVEICSEICNKLEERLAEVMCTMRTELKAVKDDAEIKFSTLQSNVTALEETVSSVTSATSQMSDTITELESTVSRLRSQVDVLTEKCVDLEGRSKRQNLRLVGIKEGMEFGRKTGDFVAEVLKEVLELEETPLVDRAHRALRSRPESEAPPRHIILKIHYSCVFEDIVNRVSKKRDLMFRGQRIFIFRDFPAAVVKQRAAFTPVRALLRGKPGVKYGLLYPARLRVTLNGKETIFTDHLKALEFAERHFGSSQVH